MKVRYIGNGSFRFGDRPLNPGEIVDGPFAAVKALSERPDFEVVKESKRRKKTEAEAPEQED